MAEYGEIHNRRSAGGSVPGGSRPASDDRAVARTLRSDIRAFGARVGDAVPGWVGGAMAGLQSILLSMGATLPGVASP